MQMVKQDKFSKFYIIYLWFLFIILIGIWGLSITTIPASAFAQENKDIISTDPEYKLLKEENSQLKLELQNLKEEKFNASFQNCKIFCGCRK